VQEQVRKRKGVCRKWRRLSPLIAAFQHGRYARAVDRSDLQSTDDAAIALSLFRHFPTAERNRLFDGARRVDASAGSALFLGALPQPALVVRGVIKVFMTAPDGRQVTIHYLKEGGTLGILAMVGGPPPVRLQAIAPTTLLVLDAAAVKAVAMADVTAAWAVAQEFAAIYRALLDHMAVNVFGSVRQRICNHLLSLASAAGDGSLIVPVTQQELANAAGTAREVVSRTLGSLSRAGVVSVTRDRIAILDASKLLAEVETLSSI
jgi:CRP/FNR family transcriptional regulator